MFAAIDPNWEGGMKSVLMTVALSVLIAAPASAADLRRPAPAPVVAPLPVVTAYNWSSCYIGGHGGGVWVDKKWNANDFGDFADLGSHGANGWLAGVQAGCDWQFGGGWVIGIAADYAWVNADGSNVNPQPYFDRFSNHSNVRSVGSATVRLGYAWDRFLGYVKGGAAWESDSYVILFENVYDSTASESRRLGWTVGVGGEYAFTNWVSAFVEYNYYDFGSRDRNFCCGYFSGPINIDERKHVVKGGLNFRFGQWFQTAPVVARY